MRDLLFLLCVALFLIGCGGEGTGVRIASPLTGPVADTTLAANAIKSSPWSTETIGTSSTTEKTSATSNVQSLITSIIATEEQALKKGKSSTTTFDKSVVGPNGGAAIASGTMEITTTPITVYPITTATEATITFDGYVGANFSVHGSTEYSGSTTITAAKNFETNFTTHGGYSYKDSTGAYSFSTQMDVNLKGVDGVYSGSYTYVINGETYTGSF